MLWLLGRAGAYTLLGDRRGAVHLVREISGVLDERDLHEPITVRSREQLRAALGPLPVPVWRRVTHEPSGLDVACAYAESTWFVRA